MGRFLRVRGDSLIPEYQEGDFVFVSKIPFFFASPQVGQIVAFNKPPYGILIKRIDRVIEKEQSFWVLGSHPFSVDSRQFGAVHRRDLIGRVIWHIPRLRS